MLDLNIFDPWLGQGGLIVKRVCACKKAMTEKQMKEMQNETCKPSLELTSDFNLKLHSGDIPNTKQSAQTWQDAMPTFELVERIGDVIHA